MKEHFQDEINTKVMNYIDNESKREKCQIQERWEDKDKKMANKLEKGPEYMKKLIWKQCKDMIIKERLYLVPSHYLNQWWLIINWAP